MIKAVFVIMCMLYWMDSDAQIQKGNIAIGGSASFQISLDDSRNYSGIVSPFVGKFVTDNLLLSADLGFGIFKSNFSNTDWWFSLGPGLRYYLAVGERVSPYINFSVRASYNNRSLFSRDDWSYQYFGGGGLSFHLNKHLTLDGQLVWQHLDLSRNQSNTLALMFGFSIFLDREREQAEK